MRSRGTPQKRGAPQLYVSGKNMQIELKGLYSPDLEKPHIPDDPVCCAVFMQASIGAIDSKGADTFNFTVVTPSYLLAHQETRWSSGLLMVSEFSWLEVERMIARLVSSVSAKTWDEAAKSLGRFLEWEFENYQPYQCNR